MMKMLQKSVMNNLRVFEKFIITQLVWRSLPVESTYFLWESCKSEKEKEKISIISLWMLVMMFVVEIFWNRDSI